MDDAEFLALARAHAAAEGLGDLEGTLATLDVEPVFELYPVGLRLTGMARVRRYYEHFLQVVSPCFDRDGIVQLAEWVGPTGLIQEYHLPYRYASGEIRVFHIVSELVFGRERLLGERMSASEELFRIMYAPLWNELELIEGGDAWARSKAAL